MKFNLFKFEEANIFVWLAIVVGLIMVFLMPPFQVPDENAHFYKSWEVAGGQFYCSDDDEKLNEIPKEAEKLPAALSLLKTKDTKLGKFDYIKVKKDITGKVDYSKKEAGRGVLCGAIPIGFIPQSTALKIGETLRLPQSINFYLGRIFNLFTSISLIYLAIKIIPYGKKILMLVGLLPMTIQQLASFSYDAIHIGLILLFIAYILKLCSKKDTKINKKEIVVLFCLSLLGFNIKFGYFILSFLILLLPSSKFKNKKKYTLFVLSFILANLIFFFLCYLFFKAPPIWPDGILVNEQISFVLHYPWEFLSTVINSLNRRSYSLLMGIIGIQGLPYPGLFYVLAFSGIIFFTCKEKEKVFLSLQQRLLLFLVFLANVLFIFLALYLIWTPVGSDEVNGVQGRYLLSILPLLIFSFYKLKVKKKILNCIFIGFIIIGFIGVFLFLLEEYHGLFKKSEVYTYERIFPKKELKGNKEILNLTNQMIVRQTFYSRNEKLRGIKLYFPETNKTSELVLKLRDAQCDKTLRESKVKVSNKNEDLDIEFGLIPDSNDKKYCLEITSNPNGEVLLLTTKNDFYKRGELKANDEILNRDLIFKIIYE